MTIPVVRQAPCNPRAAADNRRRFDAAGVVCLNLTGPVGSGKTSLIEAVLPRLGSQLRIGVIASDLATTCDAQRLGACGVPVVQVLTDGECRLEADQVQHALSELPLDGLDLLIIENFGSLLSQARTDLGEHLRIAAAPISGGQAVVIKYPQLFRDAALVVLTKYDLLPHVEFDLKATRHLLERLNPQAEIICTDSRKRLGIDRLAGWLLGYVRAHRLGPLRRVTETHPLGI